MLFSFHLPKHIISLKFTLYSFELLPGSKINFDKSSVLVLNDFDIVENLVANTLNFKTMSFTFDYFGFVIRPAKLKHDDWFIIIDKIKNRISNWNGRLLSRAGRLVLINSVLLALPIYWMSCIFFLIG